MRYFLSVVLVVFAGWAAAQSYPEPSDLSVNDYAGIIGDEAENRLTEKLDILRETTGVELVVVTLSRQDMFAPDLSLKKFARGIFNEWGIGHKKRDDGILVLVLRGDQAMRITLGKGFGKKAEKAADKAVERSFLPEFREDRYEQGIENGVTDLIENTVGPHLARLDEDAGQSATEETAASTTQTETSQPATGESASTNGDAGESKDGLSWLLYVLGGIGALIGFLVFKSKTRKCPECGAKGSLTTSTNTLEDATETSTGKGERITTCGKCGYKDVESYTISKRSKPEPEEFSGGEAGKKGATGKW